MPSSADLAASNPSGDALATSRSLLDRARHKDADAWRQLVELYTPFVCYWCRRGRVPDQDLADVVQEVFRALVGGLSQFRKEGPGDTFRGWVRTVTRNKVSDYFRQGVRAGPQGAGGTQAQRHWEQLADAAGGDLNAADESAERALLWQGLEALRGQFEPQVWQAFWMVVVEERPVADVAAELGMPPGTVRVYKCRVSQRLRQALGDVD